MTHGSTPIICLKREVAQAEYETVRSVTRQYVLYNFTSRKAAEDALVLSPLCPLLDPDYPALQRRDIVVETDSKIAERITASATWEFFLPEVENLEILSGSISTSTQNIRYTRTHIGSYGPGSLAPMSAGGALNVTPDGIDGLDIEFPVMSFTIRRLIAKGTFNLAFLANAYNFQNRPNSVAWRGFPIETIKIVGIDGSNDGVEFDEVLISFEASPTFVNITIPSPFGNIVIPEKKGWQYLHLQYLERQDPSTGKKLALPHTAHVDQPLPLVDINGFI